MKVSFNNCIYENGVLVDGSTSVPLALNMIAKLSEPNESIIDDTLKTQPNSGLNRTSLLNVEPKPYWDVALAGGNIYDISSVSSGGLIYIPYVTPTRSAAADGKKSNVVAPVLSIVQVVIDKALLVGFSELGKHSRVYLYQ